MKRIPEEVEERKQLLFMIRRVLKEMERNEALMIVKGDIVEEKSVKQYTPFYKALQSVLSLFPQGVSNAELYQTLDEIFSTHDPLANDMLMSKRFREFEELAEFVSSHGGGAWL